MTLRHIESIDAPALLALVSTGSESDADTAFALLLGMGWEADEIESMAATRAALAAGQLPH